jgi:GTPase SAR1 family protein
MKGKYLVDIGYKRLKYHLEIKRMITIIVGDSGTGKTTLINMLKDYLKSPNSVSGLKFSTTAGRVSVLDKDTDWYAELDKTNDTIFFADECIRYCRSDAFVTKLKSSGNYLVYISRDARNGGMHYAVNEIYEFHREKKNSYYLNSLYNFYTDSKLNMKPNLVITEDSTSGLDTIKSLLKCEVVTSNGKDNMVNTILSYQDSGYNNIYVIVDGAAYGNEIEDTIKTGVYIFAPESFEWLLLVTDTFNKYCKEELSRTYDFAESSLYETWENYYEYLLKDVSSKYLHEKYSKKHLDELSSFWSSESLFKQIKTLLIDID